MSLSWAHLLQILINEPLVKCLNCPSKHKRGLRRGHETPPGGAILSLASAGGRRKGVKGGRAAMIVGVQREEHEGRLRLDGLTSSA